MDARIEIVKGCQRVYYLPWYARYSLGELRLDSDAANLLALVLQALDRVYPDDPFIDRDAEIMVLNWYEHPDLEDPQGTLDPPGIKVLFVEALNVTIVFWEGNSRTVDGRAYLSILGFVGNAPHEIIGTDAKRLVGLACNVAMKYDALL